ncbi:hypothetical protein TWF481_010611 [Arthrobotrys musiformis]|uniref:Uncharacterized protein n=1 Tax=Arthrobotrys musiformis TaxID=47236 RepID=A0AAV9W351_9PEZI
MDPSRDKAYDRKAHDMRLSENPAVRENAAVKAEKEKWTRKLAIFYARDRVRFLNWCFGRMGKEESREYLMSVNRFAAPSLLRGSYGFC